VVPNAALLAWVERMTGKDLGELFADEEGKDLWCEINELVQAVTRALELPTPAAFAPGGEMAPTPRSDAEDSKQASILASGVIGLLPAANQGLLTDLEALHDGEPAVGPIESFLKPGINLGVHREAPSAHAQETTTSLAGSERCVSQVDPCQARAVHLARKVKGLVIHGPQGTGKSQTITNLIGDHLASGERVLFVCDKRTALDVVAYHLNHIGLGSPCAVVHDARRDQRDLYRGIREQLDTLAETSGRPGSVAELSQIDAEILRIHAELTQFPAASGNESERRLALVRVPPIRRAPGARLRRGTKARARQQGAPGSRLPVARHQVPVRACRRLEHLRDEHGISSWVHWGNDGFAVDTALVHPERPDDVTIGLLCDGSRFAKAADRVQWDIFRAEVLESQKWRLLRLWSPQLFRTPAAAIARVKKAVDEWLAEEAPKKAVVVKERPMDARLLN
jgi:hypothetical protein